MSRTRDLWQEVLDLYQAAVMRQRRKDLEGARRALDVAFERCMLLAMQEAGNATGGLVQTAPDTLTAATLCLASGRAELEAGAVQNARERLWAGIGLLESSPTSPLLTHLRMAYLEALLARDDAPSVKERQRACAQISALVSDEGRGIGDEGILRARLGLLLAQLPGTLTRPLGIRAEVELNLARELASAAGAVGLEAAALGMLVQNALERGDQGEATHWQREQWEALESIQDQEGLGWLRLERARLKLKLGHPWAARKLCLHARKQLRHAGSALGEEQAHKLLQALPFWLVLWMLLRGGTKRLELKAQG